MRTFCRVCGATLVSLFEDNPKTLGLAMGTLDDDPRVRPVSSCIVGSKAHWFEITDDLPQFDALPASSIIRKDGSSGKE
jgi:hypothetical protein